ncbi:MAG: hypothetical protein ACOC6G_00690 [Thermoproteota archaeon]
MANKFCIILLLILLPLSFYLAWEYKTSHEAYDELSESWRELSDDYQDLREDYSDLQEDYRGTFVHQNVGMPKGLDQHYERIRGDEGSRLTAEGDQGFLLFYGTQVLHDLGRYRYDPHYTEFYQTSGVPCKNLTEGFSIDFLDYIEEYSNWMEWESNLSKMEKIYRWTDHFLQGTNETDGFGRFPIETLTYRYGDCEDQAMATAFLLEASGYQTALCLIQDENLTRYSSQGFHHSFCAVKKEDEDYSGSLMSLPEHPELGVSWILLDPSFNHQFGELPDWIDYYRRENGTIRIPPGVMDCLILDYRSVEARAAEMGINLDP